MDGLIPGHFLLVPSLPDGTDLYADPLPFDVVDRDITNLEIKVRRGVTVSGSISTDPAVRTKAARHYSDVQLEASWRMPDGQTLSRTADVEPDGSFEIRGLRPSPIVLSMSLFKGSRYFTVTQAAYADPSSPQSKRVIQAQDPLQLQHEAAIGRAKKIRELMQQRVRSTPAPAAGDSRPVPVAPAPAPLARASLSPSRFPYEEPTEFFGHIPFVSLNVGNSGIQRLVVAVNYHNAVIKCHVDIMGGRLAPGEHLYASVGWQSGGGSHSTSPKIDSNGNMELDGLEPGTYTISISGHNGILAESKTVELRANSEAAVNFTVNLSRQQRDR